MPSIDCLTRAELRLFLAGQLPPGGPEGIELHLSRCLRCRHRLVSLYENSKMGRAPTSVPYQLKASALGISPKRRVSFSFLILNFRRQVVAGLALAVLVTLSLTNLILVGPPGRAHPVPAVDVLLRELSPISPAPQLIAPSAGVVTTSDPIQFRWSRVPGANRYTFTLLDEKGDVAFQASTMEAHLGLRRSLVRIKHGKPYFWYVEAILSEGTAADSEVRKLVLK